MAFSKGRTFIYPWNNHSKSTRALKEVLGIKSIKRENSTYVPKSDHVIINWGNSELPWSKSDPGRILNDPYVVNICSNKLDFFKQMSRGENTPRIPAFTTSTQEAISWVKHKHVVLARTFLRGSGGRGIVFLDQDNQDNWIEAKLYTQYKKKKAEFRVHFAFGNDIDVQKKVLRKTDDNGNAIDPSTIDFRIRNLENGFIFQRNDIEVPSDVITQARLAFFKTGLDFGAVDVIYNEEEDKAYVLEINTAMGLEGTTVEKYANAFMENL